VTYADWFAIIVVIIMLVLAYTMICKGWSLWVAGFTGDTKEELDQYDGKAAGRLCYPLILFIGLSVIAMCYKMLWTFAICFTVAIIYGVISGIYIEKDDRKRIRKK
jgi:preprotein translocase subunit SecF